MINLKKMADAAFPILKHGSFNRAVSRLDNTTANNLARQVAEEVLKEAGEELWGLGYKAFNDRLKKLRQRILGKE